MGGVFCSVLSRSGGSPWLDLAWTMRGGVVEAVTSSYSVLSLCSGQIVRGGD